ncbi:uncharacterized protein LOC127281394 isoform X1 [Leptopilina boulardi]|uniref:uncharacterized protein LOC127281394 isoform X1 n=1 Tax=Leptopilina boulardi TaxID=63433 RepID=UPI0021F5A7FB|nr:uncharacterized protein LOC127281394 isoform X1 [Leptopilina boulardi]
MQFLEGEKNFYQLVKIIMKDFFQGSNENLTTREEYFFTTQEINTDYYQRNHEFTKKTMTMSSEEFPNDYDYEKLKNEYLQQIDEMKRKNEIFIYTESENFEEIITTTTTTIIVVNNKSLEINKNLNVTMKNNQIFKEANNKSLNENNGKNIKIKKLLNCTKIESFFIGPKTIECLSNAYKNIKSLLDLLKALQRTWNVTKFWILLYISISIACWCQRGWCCCCCCCCEFCYPEEVILNEKKYFAENPPGILVKKEKDGKLLKIDTEKYEATLFEIDAYGQMESQIRNL